MDYRAEAERIRAEAKVAAATVRALVKLRAEQAAETAIKWQHWRDIAGQLAGVGVLVMFATTAGTVVMSQQADNGTPQVGMIGAVWAEGEPEPEPEPDPEPEAGVDRTSFDIAVSNWGRKGSLIASDVNGDGQRDLIISQPSVITAYNQSGTQLWALNSPNIHLGDQAEGDGQPGLHGPGIQAGDIDNDATTEVIYVTTDNRLRVINGPTGAIEATIPLPAISSHFDRWEHAIIANFQGLGDRDLLLSTSANITGDGYLRAKKIGAYSFDSLASGNATALWGRDDFHPQSHGAPLVADLDGDGRDEVVGGMVVDHLGVKHVESGVVNQRSPHVDSVAIGDIDPASAGLEVVIAEEGGDRRIIAFNKSQVLWSTSRSPATDGDKTLTGDFDTARSGLETHLRGANSNRMWVMDQAGNRIATYDFDAAKEPQSWTDEGIEVIFSIHVNDGHCLPLTETGYGPIIRNYQPAINPRIHLHDNLVYLEEPSDWNLYGWNDPLIESVIPEPEPVPDDTFACLASWDGPTVNLSGNNGYERFLRQYWNDPWEPETIFDARGGTWLRQEYPEEKNQFPIGLGPNWRSFNEGKPAGPKFCWAGGIVEGTDDPAVSGSGEQKKGGNGGAIQTGVPHAVVDGLRAHNGSDGVRLSAGSTPFTYKDLWVSHMVGDCIENDSYSGGLFEDNLFDGCYTVYSAVNPDASDKVKASANGGKNKVIFKSNLLRMKNVLSPYDGNHFLYGQMGYHQFFKFWQSITPEIELHNNVLYLEEPMDTGLLRMGDANHLGKFVGCSGNLLIWPGPGTWPHETWKNLNDKFPGCFTVTKDVSLWDKARTNWINCHPKVGRVAGDPASDLSRCDPNAFGGRSAQAD